MIRSGILKHLKFVEVYESPLRIYMQLNVGMCDFASVGAQVFLAAPFPKLALLSGRSHSGLAHKGTSA